MKERTCNKCGRVAFAVTYEAAQAEVDSFNAMYDELTEGEKQRWYGGHGATIKNYERCLGCGNSWKDFRDAVDGDCPDGCTMSPIIVE